MIQFCHLAVDNICEYCIRKMFRQVERDIPREYIDKFRDIIINIKDDSASWSTSSSILNSLLWSGLGFILGNPQWICVSPRAHATRNAQQAFDIITPPFITRRSSCLLVRSLVLDRIINANSMRQ